MAEPGVLTLPALSLVLLVGASGSGKTTFARQQFKPTEIVSSDALRGWLSDDENDQSATRDAFEVLHLIVARRLARGKLTVVDATNLQSMARNSLLEVAKHAYVQAAAIVFDLPARLHFERREARTDRNIPLPALQRQLADLRRSVGALQREGIRPVYVLRSPEEVESARVIREPLRSHKQTLSGPFDIIGDVHGCYDELHSLLDRLGYQISADAVAPYGCRVEAPAGRTAIFLGDLVDRGPQVVETLRLAMSMLDSGSALMVQGNHENKLLRALNGRNVQMTHGLPETLAQLAAHPGFEDVLRPFLDGLPSHYVLDGGRLVVAHAGLQEAMHGRSGGAVRDFALYGETTGETDEYGLPVRYEWARDYRGQALVVYGHTAVQRPEWLNNTICVDTGCVYGGALTALRYPERELISVPAARTYYASPSFEAASQVATSQPGPALQASDADLLDLADVQGQRSIETRLAGRVTIREENAAAALEAMSRFAADPRWLVYLPPTMSPAETSSLPDLLEHPAEAFAYYRREGVGQVVCEEKHMGSRAVVVVCRDAGAARRRFGIAGEPGGLVYTRTGRPFFDDAGLHAAFLQRVRDALGQAGWWDRFQSDWALLDAELLPWSAKAQGLLREQYAAAGAAAHASLPLAIEELERAEQRGLAVSDELARQRDRLQAADQFVAAYRRYCWPVGGLDDLRLAPFHLLATEAAVHTNRDHVWHMQTLAELSQCSAGEGLLMATPYRVVDLHDAASVDAGVRWWEDLTERGGEGMVVKPFDFLARNARGRIVQPAVKCRGREYLRLIYGPEYTNPTYLEQLRSRGVGAKRSLAFREFALGLEALERFVAHEPLRRVHECVFGVLALESEPVDPRL